MNQQITLLTAALVFAQQCRVAAVTELFATPVCMRNDHADLGLALRDGTIGLFAALYLAQTSFFILKRGVETMSHEYLLVFTIEFNMFHQLPALEAFIGSGVKKIKAVKEEKLEFNSDLNDQSVRIKKFFYYGNIFACRVELPSELERDDMSNSVMKENAEKIEQVVNLIFPDDSNIQRPSFVWTAVPWTEFIDDEGALFRSDQTGSLGGIGTGRG